MSKATEAQLEAAYDAYYSAVADWSVTKIGNMHVVAKRAPNKPVVEESEATNWRFEDKETADMTATGLIDWALRKIAQENT